MQRHRPDYNFRQYRKAQHFPSCTGFQVLQLNGLAIRDRRATLLVISEIRQQCAREISIRTSSNANYRRQVLNECHQRQMIEDEFVTSKSSRTNYERPVEGDSGGNKSTRRASASTTPHQAEATTLRKRTVLAASCPEGGEGRLFMFDAFSASTMVSKS
eukprot:6173606-Pleurochrysis_carterae.AAC.1